MFSSEYSQLGDNMEGFNFFSVPGLQGGIPYDVSARHGLNINANGSVDFYWSDYGTSCTMGLTGGVARRTDINLISDISAICFLC